MLTDVGVVTTSYASPYDFFSQPLPKVHYQVCSGDVKDGWSSDGVANIIGYVVLAPVGVLRVKRPPAKSVLDLSTSGRRSHQQATQRKFLPASLRRIVLHS